MDTKKNREQIIKEFLGLEELSPMEAGVIQGGNGKYFRDEPYDKAIEITDKLDVIEDKE